MPPRAIAYTLRMVLRDHVMELAIEDLLASGFEERFASPPGATAGPSSTSSRPDSIWRTRSSGRWTSPRTRDAPGRSTPSANACTASAEDRFGEDRDGVRIFLEGTLAATDARTRVYYGDDAETVRRLFTDTYMGIGVEIIAVPEGIELEPLAGGRLAPRASGAAISCRRSTGRRWSTSMSPKWSIESPVGPAPPSN